MKRLLPCLAAAVLVSVPTSLLAQTPPPAAADAPVVVGKSDFYPLDLGSEWTYDINGQTVVARVTKHEKIGEHAAGKVDSFLGKQKLSSEHIAVLADGVYRVAFDGAVADKPVMILKLPPKDGESWTVDTSISGNTIKGTARCDKEAIEVPAGKFDAFRVTGSYTVTAADGSTQTPSFTFWFAEKTGVAKLGTGAAGSEVMLNLKSFERGKK
jgi:hypothetical protein